MRSEPRTKDFSIMSEVTEADAVAESPVAVDGPPKQTVPRTWPAFLAVAVVIAGLVLQQTPSINNGTRFFVFQLLCPLVGLVIFAVWALGLSRVGWKERVGLMAWLILPAVGAGVFTHKQTGVMLWIYGLPAALIVATVLHILMRSSSAGRRMAVIAAGMLLVWSFFPFVRVDGIDGNYRAELSPRWQPERDLALESGAVAVSSDKSASFAPILTEADWPRFRGPQQDGRVTDAIPEQDWAAQPPLEIWRIDIGPGWGSFAAAGGRLFTQEQRGDDECVTCLDAATGETIWRHVDQNRFSETVSGPGPRATPTYDDGIVYTYGSKGILNALDAATGEPMWSRDIITEFDAPLPIWGFSNSPLIVETSLGKLLVLYAGGSADHGLCAFRCSDGELAWEIAAQGMNYSSAHLATIDDTSVVLFVASTGLHGLSPETGEKLWSYEPENWTEGTMVQPRPLSGGSILTAIGDAGATARIEVTRSDESWTVEELWNSRDLKPSFNDYVIHDGHAYGFDQNIVACIDLQTGKRAWKRGRYGFGQLILLEEAGQIVVAGEQGELVLLDASPEKHRELGRFEAFEGKTWNHPVVADGKLYHRNGVTAVCYDLRIAESQADTEVAAR